MHTFVSRMSQVFIFVVTPHCTAHAKWFYNHLIIQLLWDMAKRGTVVFLPILVIFDIRGIFLSIEAIISTTW